MVMMYGYGIDFNGISLPKLMDFVKTYPEDYKEYQKWLEEKGNKESNGSCMAWINTFEDSDGCRGFGPYFADKLSKTESINLWAADNSHQVILPERSPWEYNKREKNLSIEELSMIFSNWTKKVTDERIPLEFCSVACD